MSLQSGGVLTWILSDMEMDSGASLASFVFGTQQKFSRNHICRNRTKQIGDAAVVRAIPTIINRELFLKLKLANRWIEERRIAWFPALGHPLFASGPIDLRDALADDRAIAHRLVALGDLHHRRLIVAERSCAVRNAFHERQHRKECRILIGDMTH